MPSACRLGPGVQAGREGTQGFGQDHVGPAVQDAGHLGIPFHRHGGHGALRAHLKEVDSQLHHQGADAVLAQPIVHLLGNPCGREFRRERARREIVHHGN